MSALRVLFGVLLIGITGCSAMMTSIEYAELDIVTTTERPIFLRYQPVSLYLALDNPVVEFAGLEEKLKAKYATSGYVLAEKAEEADLILYIQIGDRQHRKISARAVQGHSDMTASGGALAGAAAGFISGPTDPVSAVVGAVAGAAIGAVGDITINSLAHLGILDLQAGILAREKLPPALAAQRLKLGQDGYHDSESEVTARAKQANISWEKAAGAIEDALAAELGRILPQRTSEGETP